MTSGLALLAIRTSRHATAYALSMGLTLLLGIVQVAVLTRLLPAAEFGQFALLSVSATLGTVIANLGSLQGSLRAAFGASGDEEIDESDSSAPATDARTVLGSGLALTALTGLVVASIVVALSAPLTSQLLSERATAAAFVWVGIALAFGAIWRLILNVPRLERRARVYVRLAGLRGVCVLTGTTLLAATAGSAQATMAGLALGTATATLVGLCVIRGSYRPALRRRDVRNIYALGAPYVPMSLAFGAMQNGDLLLLARFAGDTLVADYRVAGRLASGVSYLSSAFFMAWGPVARGPLSPIVERERGFRAANATILTYFTLTCAFLLLGLTLFAPVIAGIAGPQVAGAGDLLPFVGTALLAHASFVFVYRTSLFKGRRDAFVRLAVLSATCFAAAALVLIPALDARGAALALTAGYGVGIAGLVVLGWRRGAPLQVEVGRVLGILAAFASGLLTALALREVDVPQILAGCAGIASFGCLVVLTGIIPIHHLSVLRSMLVAPAVRERRLLAAAIHDMPDRERTALRLVLHDARPPREVATRLEIPEGELPSLIVDSLRLLDGGRPGRTDFDEALGNSLLATGASTDGDRRVASLARAHPDAAETIERLGHLASIIGQLPAGTWSGYGDEAGQ